MSYQFQDSAGKTYVSQYKFPRNTAKILATGSAIDIAFLRSNPKHSYPIALLEYTRKVTYLLRNVMIAFSIFSLVPLLTG